MLYLVVRHLLGNFQVLLSCFVIGLVENVNFIHKTNRSRVKYEIAVNYPYQYIATQTQHLKGVHKKGTNFRKEHYIW
ncbi:MAG TPA: hypothetical protein ENK67_05820 [Flavobacteriia bacterium]|nr:hypothetical protein [Flavobacteriia bacterium]